MIDGLLKYDMIEKVTQNTGNLWPEEFLVLKSRDLTGPLRLVVDYSLLKYCFDRNPFKQADPFTILSALKSGCCYHFVADMSTGYWKICLEEGPKGLHIKVMLMGIQPASDM